MCAPTDPDRAAVRDAAAVLRRGGLVAFPTETVYGIGADLFNESAVRRIYDLKRRPFSRPLLAHVSGVEMAETISVDWSDRARALATRFWPGPLTLVVPKAQRVPDVATSGGSTIGLRCPAHDAALALIEALGAPIAGTSANRSDEPPAVTADQARRAFPPEVVHVLDAGPAGGGLESTVLMLGGDPSQDRILRRGPITAEQLGVTDSGDAGVAAMPSGPGGGLRVIGAGELDSLPTHEQPDVILSHHPLAAPPPGSTVIPLPDDPEHYLARLYEALPDATRAAAPGRVAVIRPETRGQVWDAIRDRLQRLTGDPNNR